MNRSTVLRHCASLFLFDRAEELLCSRSLSDVLRDCVEAAEQDQTPTLVPPEGAQQ